MKKIYIKPNTKIVFMLPVAIMEGSANFGYVGNSSSREANDRFDWGASDDDDE